MEQKIHTVQDEARERHMRTILRLNETGEGRMGADAQDEKGRKFELKSGTKNSITTARDVGLHTLEKWRSRHWIVALGKNYAGGFEIDELYYLSPSMMEGWFKQIENRLTPDIAIWKQAKSLLGPKVFASVDLMRLDYLISRGVTLNNPKIPMAFIRQQGRLLSDPYHTSLRKHVV